MTNKFKSKFMSVLAERGFLHQLSDADGVDDLFNSKSVSAYVGFDPTASSLHVGSLIQIMILHWLKKTGHRPIVVLGGATGLVGDPSFKNETRKMLSTDTVEDNLNCIKGVFLRVLGEDVTIRNNSDWIKDLNFMTFLRDVGQHFSVNQMLAFDSVRSRMADNGSLSFLEFNYMVLQAFDFVSLFQQEGVRVQLGGSDQWGNIVNGIHLGHKMGTEQLFGITTPLLTNANGEKMGKTVNGAVWLNEEKLSNFDFWQFWRNVDDRDVHRFLKLFTTLPISEIENMTDFNEAKIVLANEVTRFVRGEEAKVQARTAAKAAFSGGDIDNLPSVAVAAETLVVKVLQDIGFTESLNAGKRLIKQNGIKLDSSVVVDDTLVVPRGIHRLSMGKKKHIKVVVE